MSEYKRLLQSNDELKTRFLNGAGKERLISHFCAQRDERLEEYDLYGDFLNGPPVYYIVHPNAICSRNVDSKHPLNGLCLIVGMMLREIQELWMFRMFRMFRQRRSYFRFCRCV